MWASEAEIREQLERETFSEEEWYEYQMQRAEIDAENAWLRAAEAPTLEDMAFERWEWEGGKV